jgi:AraC-like DNA-binding protein
MKIESSPLPADIEWLTQVQEVLHPIHQSHPIIVRDTRMTCDKPLPQPTVPWPERHPYCEFSFCFKGRSTQFIGVEKTARRAGSIMMMGPGVPHYALQQSDAGRAVTVHFLPTLLFELGPEGDGGRMMTRFTAARRINDWIMYPPPRVRQRLRAYFEQMLVESRKAKPGSEFRLRALLMEALVEVLRWEKPAKNHPELHSSALNWLQVEKALRFIYENYTGPIYIEQIAKAAGMSVNSLQALFREGLGMSCVKYLRAYRISQAASLLCGPGARVTEVALAVGFETLSHFNVSFRSFIGLSAAAYIRSRRRNRS